MMRTWMLLLAFLPSLEGVAQGAIENVRKRQFLSAWKGARDSIYIVSRGTGAKAGVIPPHFNKEDSFATHVGLGWWEKNTFYVNHISNEPGRPALRKESLAAFISSADVFYISLLPVKSTLAHPAAAMELLPLYHQTAVAFDFDFALHNNKFYCSEWCADILQRLDPGGLNYAIIQKKISHPFARSLLQRDTITYYPVDFYAGHPSAGRAARFLFVKE